MHSSANCENDGYNSSIMFGLSGTGKTTLSASATRKLVGDDEIIWTESGISNLEGGCYAKLINLTPESEPEIFEAISKPGAILENVATKNSSNEIDFFDSSITENTRGSYPISFLKSVYDQTKEAQHPNTIVFLSADAFGALPAVAQLDEYQAQFHFLSGYTARVAGTEIGVTEPQAVFSTCFGAPFMPRYPAVYAKMLAEFITKHHVSVWLLNTGWTKADGTTKRFPLKVSRTLLEAIQNGELAKANFVKHPQFGFKIPTQCKGVESKYLTIPSGTQVDELAQRFLANAKTFADKVHPDVIEKGAPRVHYRGVEASKH